MTMLWPMARYTRTAVGKERKNTKNHALMAIEFIQLNFTFRNSF